MTPPIEHKKSMLNLTLDDIKRLSNESDEDLKLNSSESIQAKFKVINVFGTLSNKQSSPVFALIDWHGHECYDLRRWDNNMSIPKKGLTFTKSDLMKIARISQVTELNLKGRKQRFQYSNQAHKATIYDNICCLSSFSMWNKEINVVDWGNGLRIDLRKWTKNYDQCSKGISISGEEFNKFIELIKKLTF